jgi:hypothetical protein
MTTPGFFELYPSARPALPAGSYTASSTSALSASPPAGADGTIPVDDTQFSVHVDAPRYVMPPDQILSTFPPAGSQGDWRERLPQIVLKRRTLPWERNPEPGQQPETAPPWLALIVLSEGEGLLSIDVDVSQCVTPGVDLGPDADVATGKYLEVSQDVIDAVFPCQDELDLLCHVRKVDLSDTELALGDDDGYLAVVIANRLPQPAPPVAPGGDPQPRKYTAYLINLEEQTTKLPATEPEPVFQFDATLQFTDANYQVKAPNASLDQIAMQLGPGAREQAPLPGAERAIAPLAGGTELIAYGTGKGLETAASSWATGPVKTSAKSSGDLAVASGYKLGLNQGVVVLTEQRVRFPVLVSWDFTCTGDGGFERLMSKLDVGLLGTLDTDQPAPLPEVALTGHVALSHRSRHGDPARSWYRGPLGPQPTVRAAPVDIVLTMAHVSDQLRKVVPDGREDISLAAMFEIGRLLTLSKPTLVAAMMDWRRELFGAARARELADLLTGDLLAGIGTSIIGGRSALESLVRTHLVGAFTAAAPGALAPSAQLVTAARVPEDLQGLTGPAFLQGLGADPQTVYAATRQSGPEGLGQVPLATAPASGGPVSADRLAMARLNNHLSDRVDALTADSLKLVPAPAPGAAAAAGQPSRPAQRKDGLDRLIEQASDAHGAGE